MQACPYDALYIDPDRNTAAKCNFDASRVEMGYKPACEVVCPTQAILSGDLDDPNSVIGKRIAMEKVSVRKPEKGTKPKLFYAGVDGDLLTPTMMEPQSSHVWAEKNPGEDLYALSSQNPDRPIPGVAREVYDVPHMIPWGKKIASYLWTKSVAAGVLLTSALALNLGFEEDAPLLNVVSPIVALLFLALTMALLVLDLKKPARFFYLFTKPNLNSWLVLGGYVLVIYGLLAGWWLFAGLRGGAAPPVIIALAAVFAVASAGYSAFLFAQARGRDFWQSPLHFWHLIVHAVAAGSATLTLVAGLQLVTPYQFMSGQLVYWLGNLLVAALLAGLAMMLGDLLISYHSDDAARSGNLLLRGPLWKPFWLWVIGVGVLAPVALTLWPTSSIYPNLVASFFALVGLWVYQDLWIKAGQAMPLS
jgi:formate-dependent nitrite reductase membrane component NrfD